MIDIAAKPSTIPNTKPNTNRLLQPQSLSHHIPGQSAVCWLLVGCSLSRFLLKSLFCFLVCGALTVFSTTSLAAVDVNRATANELEQIKGIGTKTARRIIVERQRGPFESLEHLSERLSGIGPKTVLKLRQGGLCVGQPQAPCDESPNTAVHADRREAAHSSQGTSKTLVTPEILRVP